MSAMSLPGFTAEASVYKTKVHYQMASTLDQADGVSSPQFGLSSGNPYSFCGRGWDCGPCGWSAGVCSRVCKWPHGCIVGAPVCNIMDCPCSPTACGPPPIPHPTTGACYTGVAGTGTQCMNTCLNNSMPVPPWGSHSNCVQSCACCCYNNNPPASLGVNCELIPDLCTSK